MKNERAVKQEVPSSVLLLSSKTSAAVVRAELRTLLRIHLRAHHLSPLYHPGWKQHNAQVGRTDLLDLARTVSHTASSDKPAYHRDPGVFLRAVPLSGLRAERERQAARRAEHRAELRAGLLDTTTALVLDVMEAKRVLLACI